MKIARITTHVLEAAIPRPFAYSQGWIDKRVGFLVEVESETGLVGWGEGYGPPRLLAAVIEQAYAPVLIGADALATEAIWARLHNLLRDHGQRGLPIQALSALDIALWDLKGKHFDAPIHQLLGGPVRTKVQAYATGLYRLSDERDKNERLLCQEAKSHLERGFTAMKLKVGFGLDDDLSLIEAISGVIGEDVALMMDANHGYDRIQATQLAQEAEDFGIAWFEEPVAPEDLEGFGEVRGATSIAIAGGEASFTRHDFRAILEARCMDIVQPDTCAAGGLSECKKIADMAWAHGVRYVPHVWGTGVAMAAALHLLAVLPVVAPGLGQAEPLLEADQTPHPFRQVILRDPPRVVDGWAQVPAGPGLGVEIDRDALAKFTVA